MAALAPSFTITVTAEGSLGNIANQFTGTIHFTTSDSSSQVVLPPDFTFTKADNGVHTFTVTLITAGSQSLSATDMMTQATGSAQLTVQAAAVNNIAIAAVSSATAGMAFDVTVRAIDQFGNTASGYTGTVHFTSSDPAAALPPDYTFVPGTDNKGSHTFTATLNTTGSQTIQGTTARPLLAGVMIGRNTGNGLDFLSLGARLSRSFALTERIRLEAIAEGFNLTNHVNGVSLNGTFGTGMYPTSPAPSFRQLTAVGDPRGFQFALRVSF